MAEVTLRLFPKELADLLRGPQGPVVRHLIETAEKVRQRAKELVGKDTHNLEHSIVKRLEHRGGSMEAFVGSDLPYAIYHHEGTHPHVIFPKRAKVLRFTIKTGKVIFARRVNHPGTRPNRFLTEALKEVVR